MLNALKRASERKKLAAALCGQIIRRAREPVFFARLAVPDTIDGRFDIVVLHAWLALERMNAAGERDICQKVTDSLFISFEEALRDLGVGDMGLGRRMKQMGNAFFGRLKVYSEAKSEPALADAILRNVYRGEDSHYPNAHALAVYALSAKAALASCDIATGILDFGPSP